MRGHWDDPYYTSLREEMEEREREELEAEEQEARELREFEEWEDRWPWRKWRIYWRVRNKLLRFWQRWNISRTRRWLRSTRLAQRFFRWRFDRQVRRTFSDDSELPF